MGLELYNKRERPLVKLSNVNIGIICPDSDEHISTDIYIY